MQASGGGFPPTPTANAVLCLGGTGKKRRPASNLCPGWLYKKNRTRQGEAGHNVFIWFFAWLWRCMSMIRQRLYR
jgi:hypothetical protein